MRSKTDSEATQPLKSHHVPHSPLVPSFATRLIASRTRNQHLHDAKHPGQKEMGPTLLELLLRLEGDIRRHLASIRVTPLQAGMLLFLCRHAEARVTDAAAALGVRLSTLSGVVKALVRKRWVTKRRSVKDDRVVCLRLSRRGEALALQIG